MLNSSAVARGEKEGSVTLTFYQASLDEEFVKKNIIRVKRVFNETKSQFFVSAPGLNQDNISKNPGEPYKQKKTMKKMGREELCDVLRRYGLEINFSDRYSLLQNQTASFGNRSPQQLMEYLEAFIGNTEVINTINERVCYLE